MKQTFEYISIPLWKEKIPNFRETDEKEEPRFDDGVESYKVVTSPGLAVYLPSAKRSTGQAALIIPGGGYQAVVLEWEGTDVAKWLNANGIAAFVLKYRLPITANNIVRYKSPLQDAVRAIRLIRKNAEAWKINPQNIGVMGFSAGGHLASSLGTHYEEIHYEETDDVDSLSARPDFMVLVYAVISMEKEFTHIGSRRNLLGDKPNKELKKYFSSENYVCENTPPTFLVHGSDDEVVDVRNSIAFYEALREKGVEVEMHLFAHGEHGFSLADGDTTLGMWKNLCINWLKNLK